MKRLAKCTRCGELYRSSALADDDGVCPLCHELERVAQAERDAAAARRRDLVIGAVAGLVLVGALGGLIATRPRAAVSAAPPVTSVTVVSQPPAVEVLLDDHWIGTTALDGRLTIRLPPGEASERYLEFRRDGYVSQRRLIALADLSRPMEVRLEREPVPVDITSEPPGAAVWIGGEPAGVTPLRIRVAAEKLQALPIRLVREGYLPAENPVGLPPPGGEIRWSARLTPTAPRLTVESQPPGASIDIDDRFAGIAPVTVDLEPAQRGSRVHIRGRLEGYAEQSRSLTVPMEPGPTLTVRLAFSVLTRLTVRTDPPGGDVWINGRACGPAPCTVDLLDGDLRQDVQIRGEIAGSHEGLTSCPPPAPGGHSEVLLKLDLVARRVLLIVAAMPADATLWWPARERLKDVIQALSAAQQFCIAVRADADPDVWIPGTSEQKVRAYDLIDALRPTGQPLTPLDAARLPQAAEADVIWLLTNRLPGDTSWLAAISSGRRCAIHVLAAEPGPADDQVRAMLAESRGSFECLAPVGSGERAADADGPPG